MSLFPGIISLSYQSQTTWEGEDGGFIGLPFSLQDRHCQFRDLPTTRKPISIQLLQEGGQESPLTGR